MPHSQDIVIVAARRTPVGKMNGALSTLPAHKLGACVIRALLEETGLAGEDISEVILGQVLTATQGQNPARQAVIEAGLPQSVPGWGLNQVCGSGLRAVALAAAAIKSGDASIVIAGGQENMSLAPHACTIRQGIKLGPATFLDTMVHDGLTDIFNHYHMGITAENIAEKYKISREDQDAFAARSQQKAAAAMASGRFNEEIVPVTVPNRKGDITVSEDEGPRADTTAEGLAGLRPAFDKNGTVTAGNASTINDGAAALVVMSAEEAEKRGLTPLARIASAAHAGVDPAYMGTGPIPASKLALDKAGWNVDSLDLIESNEAFAAQALCVGREMKFPEEKLNVNGGAIAIGHPIGASGARILTTLLHEMKKRQAARGLATLCVGGGMGVAMCVEGIR